jgi:hypothetical protein
MTLKAAEAGHAAGAGHPSAPASAQAAAAAGHEASSSFNSAPSSIAGAREYKLLTSRDRIFEGKFDLARLEEVLNQLARQGWVAKAMSVPHLKGFSGALEEVIVVLLERCHEGG